MNRVTSLFTLTAVSLAALFATSTVRAADPAASGNGVVVAAAQRQATPDAIDFYANAVQRLLQSIARYPNSREARELRLQGTSSVWIDIDGTGRLLASGIAQTSFSPLLDDRALSTVRSTRYPAFGGAEARRRFVLPIEFIADGAS